MYLFENGKPEEFLLFLLYFPTTIEASGETPAAWETQYLHTLLHG